MKSFRLNKFRIFIVLLLILNIFSTPSYRKSLTYNDILKKGIKPKIKPDYNFPVSKQHSYGCFGFAIKHMADYKYGIKIDVDNAEKIIGKPRNSLWEHEHIREFLKLYDLDLTWRNDGETFFKLLEKGEPVLIQYKWWYDNNKSWVGHFVAVYSFDNEGVWVSESIRNKRVRVSYKDFFDESGRYVEFSYAYLNRTEE